MVKMLFAYRPSFIRYNHGVALLTAICRQQGIWVSTLTLEHPELFAARLEQIKPDYVGFSFVIQRDYTESIAYVNLARDLGYKTIVGGVYLKKGGKVDETLFDYICRGEAEILPDFLLKGDTTVFDSKYYCDDIALLPLPDYSLVNGYEFDRGLPYLQGLKILPYTSSRGCPFKCTFCEVQLQGDYGHKIRVRRTIAEDLGYLFERHMPDMFYFTDALLPYYRKDWKEQIAKVNFPFMGYIRADIEPDDLIFLHEHGLRVCAFGIESGDEAFRNNTLKKNVSDREIFRTIGLLNQLGIHYVPFFMRDIPGESDWSKTEQMIGEVGGLPMVWEYEDLEAACA